MNNLLDDKTLTVEQYRDVKNYIGSSRVLISLLEEELSDCKKELAKYKSIYKNDDSVTNSSYKKELSLLKKQIDERDKIIASYKDILKKDLNNEYANTI